MTIKVVVVDDSALMRKLLSSALSECEGIHVLDTARNGVEALKVIERSRPDIVTLDVEMPKMNGIETLQEIKKRYTLPVIMLSATSAQGITIQALEQGAEDFIEKPVSIKENWTSFKNDLESRILVHFASDGLEANQSKLTETLPSVLLNKKEHLKAIVIGASTGGPKALVTLVKSFSERLSLPVFIVQHMPEAFTSSFAERLNAISSVPVKEAKQGMIIEPGTIYLAPGGKHMTISRRSINLNKQPKRHGVRPAVDYLFESAAKLYEDHVLGIVLTGMGKDGAEGCKSIHEKDGYVLTQDKASSVVYGMPRAVVERGYSSQTASLIGIAEILKEMTG